ncbi:ribonuclease HI [Bradyrhizobium sp. CB1717]|uniref:ribonuclease H family protein n=1 Tax=Bradyrhizobium sp. CB1717 TaxID=3039154 RepID=UPI0024B217F7|nr:ribonuclease H [Bradyrhizobium sp. CB1717]WFU26312.1 ribonuclease HI [Bradyrhizobium sp. CB1717]
MSSRMNWNKRRPTFEPWYSRLDRDPFGREATNLARHGVLPSAKKAKPAQPKPAPFRMPLGRPMVPADTLAPKYALRTSDLAKAREVVSGAVEVNIWCDGSAAPTNPGVVGAGAVILADGIRVELFGGGWRGTNNAAELAAAIMAIEALPDGCRAIVISDSEYLIKGMTMWRHKWRARDFKKNGTDMANADRWRKLDAMTAGRSIGWKWVGGHNGDRMNELADQLATRGRTARNG